MEKQQFPWRRTPSFQSTSKNNNIPGTIITRAESSHRNDDGQWRRNFGCDEHLKNAKGFLGGTLLSDV